MEGWIKLHRKILSNDLWNDPTTFRLFILLILKAAHKDGVKIKDIELKRGQYIRSYSKLQEDLEYIEGRGYKKVSKSSITRSIKKLIKNGIVQIHETKHGTLFTIINYEKYQGFDEHSENEHGTVHETNLERSWNEVGTNLEPEQELKNANNANNISSTDAREENEQQENYERKILEKYLQFRAKYFNKGGFHVSPADHQAASELFTGGVPLDRALYWLEERFKTYQPKHPRDSINSLGYCVGFIFDNYFQEKNPKKFNRRKGRQEVLPKWYIEQKQREEQEKLQQQPVEEQEDLDKIQKEVEQFFKEYNKKKQAGV